MKQDPRESNGQPSAAVDAQIEQLLCDAYAAPPLPRSLRKRLDAAVAHEWQVSPAQLSQQRGRLLKISGSGLRALKSWPIAACVAAAIMLAVALRSQGVAYGWAEMVEALSRQAVVQIGGEGAKSGSRWLSVPENLLSREAGGVARLFDFGQGVLLERRVAESRVRRGQLNASTTSAQREPLVISFLLDAAGVDASGLQLSKLRVVDEIAEPRGDVVELSVTLAGDRASEAVKLAIMLDPESKLPRNARVATDDGAVQELAFSYPAAKPAELVRRSFPAELPVVDVDIAALSTSVIASATEPKTEVAAAADGAATATKTAASAASAASPAANDNDALSAARLTGAASLSWSPVTASKLTDQETVEQINATLEELWRKQKIEPARPASDEELLRCAYLDLTGRTPTVNEVRNYLSDASPDRYPALVDRLLASRDHATHLAAVWRTFLLPEGVDLSRFGGVPAFEAWLSERFAKNVPYDQLVRELLLAEGRLAKSGPLLFYAALKLDADQLAARTARVFLGMRLECAQCHDDPFEPWTQRDFWSYAAFFARISRPQGKLESVSTVMRVSDVNRGEVKLPDTETVIPPQFLDGSPLEESPESAARRRQLARWLTGAENPFFARATANRIWAHLFGRGIVDPVDGFGKQHPPRSPELLDLLAGQLIRNEFDLRRLLRTIALSRAYRLSSGADSPDEKRHDWFAQMNVKMLTAEQLYDCITVASMLVEAQSEGFSVLRVGNSRRDEFLQEFRTLSGRATEYQGGIPQALTLMNGSLIGSATDLASGGLLKSLEAPFFSDDQRIEILYLATLSRRPSQAEWNVLRQHVAGRAQGVSVQEPLADILWALLNSAEFTMNH